MPKQYVLPVLFALIATQAAQAAGFRILPSGHGKATLTERRAAMPAYDPPGSVLTLSPGSAESNAAAISFESASKAEAQAPPQNQSSPSHAHRHTLRNIVIITVAVGVLLLVLGAAAKK